MLVFCGGGKIRSPHRLGGAKILKFTQIHNSIITVSAPKGGKLHCQLRWGAMAGFAPPGSATGGKRFLGAQHFKLLAWDKRVRGKLKENCSKFHCYNIIITLLRSSLQFHSLSKQRSQLNLI